MSELNALYGGDGNPLARTAKPSTASTLGQLWSQIGPIQTVIFGLFSAVPQLIRENGMPHSIPEWVSLLLTALVTVGALHTTAPRHQDKSA